MDLDEATGQAITEVATRRTVVQVVVDDEVVGDVAKVLREFKPNLSVAQSLKDARTILESVNKELLGMPVPRQDVPAVSPLCLDSDPMKLGGAEDFEP